MCTGVLSLRLSSDEVKNVWSYTTINVFLHWLDIENFIFYVTIH